MKTTGSGSDGTAQDVQAAMQQRYKDGMSRVPSAVTVVTTNGAGGRQGVTVSAVTSVSADTPSPTLLVCINQKSATAPAILRHGRFCVNVLRADQSAIADAFAGRMASPDGDKFTVGRWGDNALGMPQLSDPLVAFCCTVVQSQLVGAHHVIFGAVQSIEFGHEGGSLIYAERRYQTLTTITAS
jgi:flavin reductase (DIM6/NTAB) family NADH-FMN oxidoreductase RutF